MARDFAEMEREFLASLKAETGRDLGEWMAAITEAGMTDRNATIDWLKSRGFQFNRASWLERIHSNGGRPVYIDRAEVRPEPSASSVGGPSVSTPPALRRSRPARPQSSAVPPALPPTDPAALETILLAAKGYRPLCDLLVNRIRDLVSGVEILPCDGYIAFHAPAEFATLNVASNQLRLGLALGDRGFDALAQKARLKGPGPMMTHMVVLNDARQIGPTLDELVLAANAQANH